MNNDDIQKRMDALGLRQRDLSEAIGLERDKVSKIFSGIRQWKASELTRLLAWLDEQENRGASGEQSQQRPLDIRRAPEQMPTTGSYDDVGAVKLRRLNLELAMGDGTDIEDWIEEREVSFDANLFHAVTSSPVDRVFIGSGIGDSMTPTIGDRDDVLIDLNENELTKGDRIYAITIEGAGAVKRLMPAGNGMVEVISDNPTHAARVRLLPRAMVKIIGRVVWSGRRH